MGIAVIFAISYNQLLGKAGLLSLGHAVYYGFGGFFAVHLISRVSDGEYYIPAMFIPLFGGLAGLVMAFILGSFTTRRGGIMFAMLSFAIAELVLASSTVFGRYYGGSIDRTEIPAFPFASLQSDFVIFYIVLFWVGIALVATRLFNASPLGQMISAAGQNSERVAFIGYSDRRLKFQGFVFSGFLAGIAGALFALAYEFVTPEIISLKQSWLILQMVFIGGIGYFWGPPLGAILLTFLFSNLSGLTDLWGLYIGMVFLSVVLFAPDGLSGITMRVFTLFKSRKQTDYIQNLHWKCISVVMIALGIIGLCELLFQLRFDTPPNPILIFNSKLFNGLFFGLILSAGIAFAKRFFAKQAMPQS